MGRDKTRKVVRLRPGSELKTSKKKRYPLGTKGIDSDGREYRYTRASEENKEVK